MLRVRWDTVIWAQAYLQQEHSESADLLQGSTYPENVIKIHP